MNKTTTSIVGLLLLLPIAATAQSAPADADDFRRWPQTYGFCTAPATTYTDSTKITLKSPFKSQIFSVYRRPGVDFGSYKWLRSYFAHVLVGSRHVVITSNNKRRVTRFLSAEYSCHEFESITDAFASWRVGRYYAADYVGVNFPPACSGVANSADIVIGTDCSW